MSNKCASFDEACRRAAGRRAYNKKRKVARAHRISNIIALDSRQLSGRQLASLLKVHESTISRDLKFIKKVKRHYRDMTGGVEMWPRSFKWLRNARDWEITFEMRYGVRVA
jgi:hypothetical protein